MGQGSTLTLEECWGAGGKVRVHVLEEGARIQLDGNPEGFIGLARVLLWMVQNGETKVDLTAFRAHAEGEPILEVNPPR